MLRVFFKTAVETVKEFFSTIAEWFIWLTSKEVGKAIDDGRTYEEVEQIVKDRAKGNFKK